MKVNVLVVAAMVITSVNAGGCGGLWSCFKGICGSKSGSSQDPPRQNLGKSKGRDPISTNKGGHDLKGHGTVKLPDCDTLFSTLKDLQTSIFMLFGKYLQSKSTISRLDIKIDNSKPRKANKYHELQSIAKATMEDIKLKAIILKEEYEETWMSFEDAECLNQSNRLLPPKKIGNIRMFLNDQTESSNPIRGVRRIMYKYGQHVIDS
ncbi:hypothetical protein BASA60_009347 [Batrachochytrium salamandrivorans]|nr:hypothetical protein BASA60_009347 [Batrachochytrium salamandrivorans]